MTNKKLKKRSQNDIWKHFKRDQPLIRAIFYDYRIYDAEIKRESTVKGNCTFYSFINKGLLGSQKLLLIIYILLIFFGKL